MKKLLIRTNCIKNAIFILAVISLLSFQKVFAQEYTTQLKTIFTDEHSSARLQHVKSAVDSKNNLYVVFLGFNSYVYFGTNRSGSWKFQHLPYFSNEYNEMANVSSYPNIAIDKDDNISIVMFGQYKKNIYWATKHVSECEGEWKFADAKKSSDLMRFRLMDEYSDMCVDQNGGLHAYCCATVRDKSDKEHWMSAVYFYKPKGSNKWQMEIVMPGVVNENTYAADPSIATWGDMVYVTIGGDHSFHFGSKKISGNKWKIERFDKFSTQIDINTWKHMTSLCVEPNGSPKFAFYDYLAGSDEGDNWFYGINVVSKSNCGNGDWMIDHSFDDPTRRTAPAIAVDSKGKTYLALGRNEFYLYGQTCECKQSWEKIFVKDEIKGNFVDMVIDHKDVVHVFYTSDYDNNLRYLTAKPKSTTEACNFRPKFTSFNGKTNVGPGEEWSATIKASDPECDPVEIYAIILPDYMTLTDHGNGTATLKATIPEGEGFGDVGGAIFCRDNQHPGTDGNNSAIRVSLKLTQEGKEKGHYKIENKCTGTDAAIPMSSIQSIFVKDRSQPFKQSVSSSQGTTVTTKTVESNAGNRSSESIGNTEVKEDKSDESISGLDPAVSKTCNEYLDEYEEWADKYIAIKKKVNANPMDMDAVMKLANMAPQIASWAEKWAKLYECGYDEGFQARYEKISDKIDEVN